MPMIQDEQPATTAGACDDETVIVPPESIWESEHAWSLEDGDDAEPGPSWRRAAAVAAAVVMVSTAAAGATLLLGRTNGDAQGRVSNATLPTIVTTTPPVTITSIVVTSIVPAPPRVSAATDTLSPAAAPVLRADDQRFLAMLARDGIPRIVSVPDAVQAAADVCMMVKRGDSLAYVESWLVPPATQAQAQAFVRDALVAYCPHAGME
jgi:hypothetical protein